MSDIALPVVSLLPFLNRNMDQKFAVLSRGPNFDPHRGYNTVKQAREDGALVLAWGYVQISFWSIRVHMMNLRSGICCDANLEHF